MSERIESLSIGGLAKRAGLTVRSLRFYETEGLLSPIRRPNGHRHYRKQDIERVQQIVVLKSIGLSLSAIRKLLKENPPVMKKVLEMQVKELQTRQQENNRSLTLLHGAMKHAEAGDDIDIALLYELIRIAKMNTENHPMNEVAKDYLTRDQLDEVKGRGVPPQQLEYFNKVWADLIAEAEEMAGKNTDPEDVEAQDLAGRWTLMVEMFTQGDKKLTENLGKMYEDRDSWEGKKAEAPFSRAVQDFVGKACAARCERRYQMPCT